MSTLIVPGLFILGTKFLALDQFKVWKEQEEETTYTTYVQRQVPYHPKLSGTFNKNY